MHLLNVAPCLFIHTAVLSFNNLESYELHVGHYGGESILLFALPMSRGYQRPANPVPSPLTAGAAPHRC